MAAVLMCSSCVPRNERRRVGAGHGRVPVESLEELVDFDLASIGRKTTEPIGDAVLKQTPDEGLGRRTEALREPVVAVQDVVLRGGPEICRKSVIKSPSFLKSFHLFSFCSLKFQFQGQDPTPTSQTGDFR